MESFLAELPDWARTLFYVAVVVFGAGVFVYGKLRPQATERHGDSQAYKLEMATVDSSSVRQLAAAIEAQNVLLIEARRDEEKVRKLVYEAVESARLMTVQINELRNTIQRLGDLLAQRR